MTANPETVYSRGSSMTRVGAPISGAVVPAKCLGFVGYLLNGNWAGLGLFHTGQWFCQFNRPSIHFRWFWLIVAASAAMVVSTVAVVLVVWSNQPEQVHLESLLRQTVVQVGINLLGPILVLFFGLRFLDGIVKSIKDLAETSRQIRDDKDFSRRVVPTVANPSCEEVGEVIANFNAMLAEIEQSEIELSRRTKSLERAVMARTADLSAANLESQTAKAAAVAATQVKSRFLAAASHDLRQPMFAINLFKDALSKTSLNEEQRRIDSSLSQSIQSLVDLLDALLDISKLDAGAITPESKLIGVHELFSGIEADFSTVANAKALRFKLQVPIGNLALVSDGQLLQSLLGNLIGNSIKFTERGGVLVGLRRCGNQAILQVRDTGMGIAPEHLDSIFEEYFQVDNPERDRAKGLGLGLSIAKRQAQLLGTEIICRSRLGKGSVFEFRLPLVGSPRKKERASIRRRAGAPPLKSPRWRSLDRQQDDLEHLRRTRRNRSAGVEH
jgi:signal transduction histidine kinase